MLRSAPTSLISSTTTWSPEFPRFGRAGYRRKQENITWPPVGKRTGHCFGEPFLVLQLRRRRRKRAKRTRLLCTKRCGPGPPKKATGHATTTSALQSSASEPPKQRRDSRPSRIPASGIANPPLSRRSAIVLEQPTQPLVASNRPPTRRVRQS